MTQLWLKDFLDQMRREIQIKLIERENVYLVFQYLSVRSI